MQKTLEELEKIAAPKLARALLEAVKALEFMGRKIYGANESHVRYELDLNYRNAKEALAEIEKIVGEG